MNGFALAAAFAAAATVFSAAAADAGSGSQAAASAPSASHSSRRAHHKAHMRRTLARKPCAEMTGDEKKGCEKNAKREAHAAYKEAKPASAGTGG